MHPGVWVHFVPLTQGLVSHASSLNVAVWAVLLLSAPSAEPQWCPLCLPRAQCVGLCGAGAVGTPTALLWAVLGWARMNAKC